MCDTNHINICNISNLREMDSDYSVEILSTLIYLVLKLLFFTEFCPSCCFSFKSTLNNMIIPAPLDNYKYI